MNPNQPWGGGKSPLQERRWGCFSQTEFSGTGMTRATLPAGRYYLILCPPQKKGVFFLSCSFVPLSCWEPSPFPPPPFLSGYIIRPPNFSKIYRKIDSWAAITKTGFGKKCYLMPRGGGIIRNFCVNSVGWAWASGNRKVFFFSKGFGFWILDLVGGKIPMLPNLSRSLRVGSAGLGNRDILS